MKLVGSRGWGVRRREQPKTRRESVEQKIIIKITCRKLELIPLF